MKQLIVLLLALPLIALAQPKRPQFVPGQIIAQARGGVDPATVDRTLQGFGAQLVRKLTQTRHNVVKVPEGQVDRVMAALMQTGLFAAVERDGIAYPNAVPNDPNYASQWHLAKIQAATAWNKSTGSSTQTIAVIDSGADPTHPDLAPRLVQGWSFVGGGYDTHDSLGHGTAVAGTIGAVTNNMSGVAGVTWKNPIMPLVVVDASGSASYSAIAGAINYAADSGVRIINISITGTSPSSTMQSAVDYAWGKGAVVFAAAGNASSSALSYPAALNNVVAVSATDSNDNLSSYSNYGSWIDVAAPGDGILTTNNGGGYAYWSGTSFASPIAAGVGALILAANPSLSASGLVSALQKGVDDLGAPGFDQYFGYGRVNAGTALGGSSNQIMTVPTVFITAPAANSTVSGTVNVTGTASDPLGIKEVDVYCDGTLLGTATNPNYIVAWNTSAFLAAPHTLTVTAINNAGNSASATQTVSVAAVVQAADYSAPVVQITSPATGARVSGNVSINVNATDNVGIQQVAIYIDGTLVSTGSAAPFTYRWNTKKAAGGSHTIQARAWDKSNNTAVSQPVAVTK